MRSILRNVVGPGVLLGLGILWLGTSSAEAQTYYTQPGTSGTWSGYAPGYPWGGYAPGSAWSGYAPGTPNAGMVQPPGTVPPVVSGPGVVTTQPGYVNVAPATGRRNLINGVQYPVRGATPYADGRPRAYYEYGTGRSVPLAKPWLPGAPGGRR